MLFREDSEKLKDYIIEQRRYFHRHPELSFEETETTAAIGRQLETMDLTPHYFRDYPGVWAEIQGGCAVAGSHTVALRADIDALPVDEKTGLSFASEKQGVMHACGHDNHIAMLLGAARILKNHQSELPGNVKILFQAAEESCHGAEYYVNHGFLDGVDAIYSSHIWGDLDAPFINLEPGVRMASCDNFTIHVTGCSAHGSAPHQGADAIVAAASIITQVQIIVSRKNDPRTPLVITIGEIQGGQRFNIIANEVVMRGTVRTHSEDARNRVEGWLRETVEATAKANGTAATLEYSYYPAPLVNDERLTDIARRSAISLYGEGVLAPLEKTMGSEDFSYYLDKIPGVFAFIGTRNPGKGLLSKNHNDHFDVDESVLTRGTALYAQFAYDYLKAYT
ncbi:MAG: amidohydrolase [Lachnospiraceae bacterium]|nr:amidohydrolase [Lachnospiraceae bacterium]